MKKLNINNKQASEVIPVINDLIDRIEQLEILVSTQNSKISSVRSGLEEAKNIWGDLKPILADVMDWTGFLDHLGLRRHKGEKITKPGPTKKKSL